MTPAELTIERLVEHRRVVQLPGVEGECWEWMKARIKGGYGEVSIAGRQVLVHRTMADLAGVVGNGPIVCHACDNPPCFNPAHLFRWTHLDHALDKIAKGRDTSVAQRNREALSCPAGHPYDADNVYLYRCRRYCRACNKRRCIPRSPHGH